MPRRATSSACSATTRTPAKRADRPSAGRSPSSSATRSRPTGRSASGGCAASGITCSYAIGFFRSHLEGRGADRGYVVTVGSTAYREAAVMMRLRSQRKKESDGAAAPPDVLSELAAKFDRFAEVLADVAERTLACGARDERSVIKLYERWLKTGSARLAEELGSHGILRRGARAASTDASAGRGASPRGSRRGSRASTPSATRRRSTTSSRLRITPIARPW